MESQGGAYFHLLAPPSDQAKGVWQERVDCKEVVERVLYHRLRLQARIGTTAHAIARKIILNNVVSKGQDQLWKEEAIFKYPNIRSKAYTPRQDVLQLRGGLYM